MGIIFHEVTKQFHLFNDRISYIIDILQNGEVGQLYFGRRIHDTEDLSYFHEKGFRPMMAGLSNDESFSLEMTAQEYPSFGTTDLRAPAFEISYEDGLTISHFTYVSHEIYKGKKELSSLPYVYTNSDDEAESLAITLKDDLTDVTITLCYSIFADYPVVTRNVIFKNEGNRKPVIDRALSMCLDFPDSDYNWTQFSGAWGRERIPVVRKIDRGITAIESRRGHSSPNNNPFVILSRENTDENAGEAIGFSFVYSGNFLAEAYADTYGMMRFVMGIHPDRFNWPLPSGESFVTPEAVICYTDKGFNDLSHSFHDLFRNNLIRGFYKNENRPILLNNWEATMMDFDEEAILKIASKGKEAGVELFVLDDGWFGKRNDDHAGLGDWYANTDKLPEGLGGLSKKINDLGLMFGFWIEPEMVNEDSDLFRAHPDWILNAPGRDRSLGRHQMVLDFSKKEVVDNIYSQLEKVISSASVSYIKWDMNRTITECYSIGTPADMQGTVYHRYILGVYDLYNRLTTRFPKILFESCSSGGARYDAGILFYAPQTWCSDDTDAIERIKIQYGTSYCYPISSIGAHVSACPNQQTGRVTPIETRANVAYFGTFGYELDLNHISEDEFELVKKQICFMKENRELIRTGDFYRIKSPFDNEIASWMVVSKDKSRAILGIYKLMKMPNDGFRRLRLVGLEPDKKYEIKGRYCYGDELINAGMVISDDYCDYSSIGSDFSSEVIVINEVK